MLAVCKHENSEVSNYGEQVPPPGIGVERFEFWCPQRRPDGHNLALRLDPPLKAFGAANAVNGIARPTHAANAWLADPEDRSPSITLRWNKAQAIRRVLFVFDTDYDHPAASTLWGHPENEMPFCVRSFKLRTVEGRVLAERSERHQTRTDILLPETVATDGLVLELGPTHGGTPPALFEIACFGG